ncbi:MAG: SMI1/KNR4 family protein [Byssovorax sp.]
MHTEDDLLAHVRTRATDPSTRIGVPSLPSQLLPGLPPPATSAMLAATEARLGFTLPRLLARVYTEVSDGGFGPGYGLLNLANLESDGRSLSSVYLDFRAGDWLERLLPLWDWGCAMWSCLDGRSDEGAIVTSNQGEFATTHFTLYSWIYAWTTDIDLSQEIFEASEVTRMGINPFTKKPMVFHGGPRSKGRRVTAW